MYLNTLWIKYKTNPTQTIIITTKTTTTPTSWVTAECWYGLCNNWTRPNCVQLCKWICFMRWNNHIQRKTFSKEVKRQENHPMIPPLDNFQKWKSLISCQNNQHVEKINFFCKLDNFWAALWTKKISPFSKSWFWKWGDCQNSKVIGTEEITILVFGLRKRPQTKIGLT